MMNIAVSLAACSLILQSASAQIVSWEIAIAKVEASANKYFDYAVELGGTSWAGTMYQGYYYERHQCAIIGRMLGQTKAIKELEEFEYPLLSPKSDSHELLVFSISLSNWVGAARKALALERHQRINVWNLDCIGEFGIPTSLFMDSPKSNAEFEFRSLNRSLKVYGDIERGFYERFLEALDKYTDVREVSLGSAGGSVRDALLAGNEIRRRGLTTTIHGNCYSACPLVFMGGTERRLWANRHRLGFHQIYSSDGVPVPIEDPIYKATAAYLSIMGIEPVTVVTWMYSAAPSSIYEPKVDSLCAPAVATWVQRVCGKGWSREDWR